MSLLRIHLILISVLFFLPGHIEAKTEAQVSYQRTEVLSIHERTVEFDDRVSYLIQSVEVFITNDEGTQEKVVFEYQIDKKDLAEARAPQLKVGDTIVVARSNGGEVQFYEVYRLPEMGGILFVFLLAVALVGRLKGLGAILGLFISITIIFKGIIPAVISGVNPLLAFFTGSLVIAIGTLYLAHGFTRRTTLALIGLISALILGVAFSYSAVFLLQLSGTGGEAGLYVDFGILKNLDMRGLLLGSIMLGTLGVLDDVTTAQAAVVEELSKANPDLDSRQLYKSALSVGTEHISSMVNTLALAYIGASLPLFIIALYDGVLPAWMIANSEFMEEEILRTVVGSLTMVLAVPLTTFMAARYYGHKGGLAARFFASKPAKKNESS
ncbi:YibE/F family protein [Magnetococcales bacterium HHB-1]